MCVPYAAAVHKPAVDPTLAATHEDLAGESTIENARVALDLAERRSGVHVVTLEHLNQLQDARAVCDTVWPESNGGTQLQPNLLRAMVHAGGYASAAYREGRPIGAAIAFLGRHREPDGTWQMHLHSHMAAVLPEARDQGIGVAVKLHQRLWAIEHDIPVVTWTFDPLVRRNARLNLVKLGASARGYEVNFYGEMPDALNAGDESDRMFAWWDVRSAQADRAGRGLLHPLDVRAYADAVEIDLPEDIVALRRSDPRAAHAWRRDVRMGIQRALAQGMTIRGISTTGGYVLSREPESLSAVAASETEVA